MVLDKLKQEQQQRTDNLFHPFSAIKNHISSSRPFVKDKYSRLNEMRQRHKLDKLSEQRQNKEEKQDAEDTERDMSMQSEQSMVELDQLIEEERQNNEEFFLEDYEKELDELLSGLELAD